jgi:hypothetical protein
MIGAFGNFEYFDFENLYIDKRKYEKQENKHFTGTVGNTERQNLGSGYFL